MKALFTGDGARVFTETMPASVKTGDVRTYLRLYPCSTDVRTPCDSFTSLIRDTLAQNGFAQSAWQAGSNVVTYRVTSPSVGTQPSNLYDTDDVYSSFYLQGCNTNETGATGAPSSCVTPTLASSSLDYDLRQIAMVLQAFGTASTVSASNPGGDTYGFFAANNGGVSINGGVGSCLNSGRNCAGGTQDTDAYRTYTAGTLKNLAPVFVVGVLHSTSPADFTPSPNYPVAAVNNADYTGISIADGSPYPGVPTPAVSQNIGIADAANPNSTSQYPVPPANRALLGSAYTVLNYLKDASGNTLYSDLPSSVQKDINNIYIHVFQRNDVSSNACTMQTCSNSLANDVTTIASGSMAGPPVNNGPGTIPDNDYALFTERGYVLPPASGVAQTTANFTGAAAQYLQSPYIVCDTAGTSCGSTSQ